LCALYIHCGILDLLYHFLHGEYLCEKQTDRRQGRTLDFVARQAGHAARKSRTMASRAVVSQHTLVSMLVIMIVSMPRRV
jgi:hypothetical protein